MEKCSTGKNFFENEPIDVSRNYIEENEDRVIKTKRVPNPNNGPFWEPGWKGEGAGTRAFRGERGWARALRREATFRVIFYTLRASFIDEMHNFWSSRCVATRTVGGVVTVKRTDESMRICLSSPSGQSHPVVPFGRDS